MIKTTSMKKLSFWAREHKWEARVLIIASLAALAVFALLSGILLRQLGLLLPGIFLFASAGLYLAAFIAYPFAFQKKRERSATAFYRRQKTCDMMLAATSFLLMLFFANRPEKIFSYGPSLQAASTLPSSLPADSIQKKYKSIPAFSASLKDENGVPLKWKEKKKLLKEQVRAIKQDRDMSDGAKAGLIILSIAVALGLVYGVAAIACNLSCSGQEGAAAVVMIGGVGVIIFLTVLVIRSIVRKNKKARTQELDFQKNQSGR